MDQHLQHHILTNDGTQLQIERTAIMGNLRLTLKGKVFFHVLPGVGVEEQGVKIFRGEEMQNGWGKQL